MRDFFTKPITLPLWGLVVLTLVALGLGGAGGASDKNDKASDTQDKVSVVTATTSQEVDELSTTEGTPTTEEVTTESTTKTLTAEEAEANFMFNFNERRVEFAEALEKDSDAAVESVDRFEYDQKTKVVILEVTSIFQTDEYLTDTAWSITRTISPMFDLRGSPWRPSLRLVVNERRSTCSADFMQRLFEKRASRSDWLRECR